ncbi:MAG: tyrosine-type recombinase/integrase [Eubacterium sp.]
MNWVAPIKDEETLKRFGETLKEVDYKYYIMFELGVGTGLQLQDILSFKNKDVTDKKEITVEIGTKNIKNTFKISDDLQKIIHDFTEGKDPDAYLIYGHQGKEKKPFQENRLQSTSCCRSQNRFKFIGAQTMRKTFAWKYYKETGDIYILEPV